MNYARFINPLSAGRKPSAIRELTKLLANSGPEMVSLAGGLPNPDTFPFTKITVEVNDGSKIQIEGSALKKSLQYLPTNGLEILIAQLKHLQNHVHSPPENIRKDSDLIITTGSQDGLCKALEMTLNIGDSIVMEEFVYPGTLAAVLPYNPNIIMVEIDRDGMIPEKLQNALDHCKISQSPMPKVMYLNPTGGNPSGVVMSLERKKKIYNICSSFDILILEDDPYYFLQFGDNRIPSFYSLDVEGRVIRFDSFSKILSSGLRLGFATGPKPLIDRIGLHMQVSTLHTSSLNQVILDLLLKDWGLEGFFKHVKSVENFYLKRRNALNQAAQKHLGDLCEWHVPDGGMFLWIKTKGISDTWEMIMEKAVSNNIMLVPGKAFCPKPNLNSPYLRAAFSVVDVDKMESVCEKLAFLIRQEQMGH